ncbi:probable methyltransferase-like protein 15 homolog [Diaphorina citri]|uniref:Probable methyltransferase-like protein 15 homolog n=1 Tax=Diaphorina citri TaxID=121845 RepID=A0A1S3D4L0_DIACI|nr:probable methyltransferase-like protein 15 homolog [Diaphorina citri]
MGTHFYRTFYKQDILNQTMTSKFLSNVLKNNLHGSQMFESLYKSTDGSIPTLLRKLNPVFRSHVNTYSCETNDNVVKGSILKFLCSQDSSDDVTMIDMTYGDGNHTRLILENIGNVKVICLDRDKESFEKAKTLAANDPRLVPVYGKFSDLPNILKNMNNNFNSIDGIIMDVGISDSQANSTRGFKPDSNSLLDMRMSQEGITGYQVLSAIDEVSLAKILKTYGEEKRSRQIARAIIETRYTFKKLERTRDLNELVASVVGTEVRVDPRKHGSEHVAQKVYNGLRRFVNNELNELNYAMIIAEKYLKPEGLLLTKCNSIVEDKIVKRHLTGNVIEHCANDLALKFVNHNLTVNPLDMSSLTSSPWTILDKIIPSDSDLKLRVAMKKESNKANVSQ